jgi:hypothetical protein
VSADKPRSDSQPYAAFHKTRNDHLGLDAKCSEDKLRRSLSFLHVHGIVNGPAIVDAVPSVDFVVGV